MERSSFFGLGRYGIIYADPPWMYKDKAAHGCRGAAFKYETQSAEWIKALPVVEIASADCALFLWATMPQLPVALEVIKSWGFTFKTVAFTWVKMAKGGGLRWGMGNWSRANAEVCILATRGKPKRICAGVHSVVMSVPGRHSEKPAEVRDRIVRLIGDVPRIELFARQRTPGWDAWGDEV